MKFLFRIAQSSIGGRFIGWIFTHMSFAIPVQRLRETKDLLVFHHPQPNYPLHILLVPKRSIRSLTKLGPEDGGLLSEIFTTVQSLVNEFNLTESGYRLIVNGGSYQKVPQLHFHLISEGSNLQ